MAPGWYESEVVMGGHNPVACSSLLRTGPCTGTERSAYLRPPNVNPNTNAYSHSYPNTLANGYTGTYTCVRA